MDEVNFFKQLNKIHRIINSWIFVKQKYLNLHRVTHVLTVFHHNTVTSARHSQFMDKVISQVLSDALVPIFRRLPGSFGGRRREWPGGVGRCWQSIAPWNCAERDRTTDSRNNRRRRRINAERLVHAQQWQRIILYSSPRCCQRCWRWRCDDGCGSRGCRSRRRVLQRRAHRTVRSHTALPVQDDLPKNRTVLYWSQTHGKPFTHLSILTT